MVRWTKPPIEEHPELVAVMTAAIHTVIQGPFRIVSIKDSNSEKSIDTKSKGMKRLRWTLHGKSYDVTVECSEEGEGQEEEHRIP